MLQTALIQGSEVKRFEFKRIHYAIQFPSAMNSKCPRQWCSWYFRLSSCKAVGLNNIPKALWISATKAQQKKQRTIFALLLCTQPTTTMQAISFHLPSVWWAIQAWAPARRTRWAAQTQGWGSRWSWCCWGPSETERHPAWSQTRRVFRASPDVWPDWWAARAPGTAWTSDWWPDTARRQQRQTRREGLTSEHGFFGSTGVL